MQYISTRGKAPVLDFGQVLLAGLASDGGLYVPQEWPKFSKDELRAMRGLSYTELAVKFMRPFVGDSIPEEDHKIRIDEAYSTFSHPEVTPVESLDGGQLHLLNLTNGPTMDFKNVALQLLGHEFAYSLEQTKSFINIIGGTSGDTGGAGMEGCCGRPGIAAHILFPYGRVSNVQRRLMTTVNDPNAHALAIQTDFDGCQAFVKAMFNDPEFKEELHATAINSINWSRIKSQVVYYAYAALKLGAPDKEISVVVPSGNFGDALAGYVAKRMGVPIKKIVVATNNNDILHRFLQTGQMLARPVVQTHSKSMDIVISSNFERLLFDYLGRDSRQLSTHMNDLIKKGRWDKELNALYKLAAFVDDSRLSPSRLFPSLVFSNLLPGLSSFTVDQEVVQQMRELFASGSANRFQTERTITNTYVKYDRLVDPHTAVGLSVAEQLMRRGGVFGEEPVVCLETAAPAKFPDVVKKCTGVYPELPDHLSDLFDRPERVTVLPNDLNVVKAHIRQHAITSNHL